MQNANPVIISGGLLLHVALHDGVLQPTVLPQSQLLPLSFTIPGSNLAASDVVVILPNGSPTPQCSSAGDRAAIGIPTTTTFISSSALSLSVAPSSSHRLSFTNRVCIQFRASGTFFEIGDASLLGGGWQVSSTGSITLPSTAVVVVSLSHVLMIRKWVQMM